MSRYSIESLERGLSVLSLFSNDTSELTLTEISRSADINMTTSLRIASTLESAGYLRRDPETKRYRPSLKVLQLGFSALRSMDIRQSARPYLERLSKETGETVSLGVLDGLEIVYVDRIRNRQIVGVVLGMGSRLPAQCTSMGKAMLAYLPGDQLKARLNGAVLEACTGNTIVEIDSFEADLMKVRRRGYAINNQELAVGLRAVAAPIWGEHGQVVAAINISGSTETISRSSLRQELVPLLSKTAAEVSQSLGFIDGKSSGGGQ
jgi:IclR family transcriptional regulator, pca regulon regulatory protein